jgi:hypothetical protein
MNWWIFAGVVVGLVLFGILGQRFGLIDVVGKSKARSAGHGAGMMGIGAKTRSSRRVGTRPRSSLTASRSCLPPRRSPAIRIAPPSVRASTGVA